jgi:hypothetical protein
MLSWLNDGLYSVVSPRLDSLNADRSKSLNWGVLTGHMEQIGMLPLDCADHDQRYLDHQSILQV